LARVCSGGSSIVGDLRTCDRVARHGILRVAVIANTIEARLARHWAASVGVGVGGVLEILRRRV
jgi:hypothetical protein